MRITWNNTLFQVTHTLPHEGLYKTKQQQTRPFSYTDPVLHARCSRNHLYSITMAAVLKAKSTFKGKDKTPLFFKLRENAGTQPISWACFRKGERLEDMPVENWRHW